MRVKIKKLNCKKCGHTWIPRKSDIKMCPKCRSICWNRDKISRRIDLTGKRFGRLIALEYIKNDKNDSAIWRCQCDCGSIKEIRAASLLQKKTRSCGCLQREIVTNRNFKHGHRNERIYKTWLALKQRCVNPLDANFKHYGERGISVCNEWLNSFMTFYNWAMVNGYKKTFTIERIDNDGNYCPENCTWIPLEKQALNRRSNIRITYNGKTLLAYEWSKRLGIPAPTISYRLSVGYPTHLVLKKGRLSKKEQSGKPVYVAKT